jgi:predicted DNA-binding transcriptional regulator YafY
VATLLLLQTRGQVTAAEVAAELEVSERTARRDLEGLAMAGLPVYSVAGRNGGWRLLGDGRTDLSGLTASEVRALFLVAGTAQASPDVRAALRKLTKALPEPFRESAENAAAALVIDQRGWYGPSTHHQPATFLDAVQTSMVESQEIALGYVAGDGRASTRTVQPLGLVSKGPTWYLIADTSAGLRTFRVDRISAVDPTGRPATRPPGFDLHAAWELVRSRVAEMAPTVTASGWASPHVIGIARSVLGQRLRIGPPAPDGRIPIEVTGSHAIGLAGQLAGFGAAIEIVEPPVVRERLAEIGQELVERYRTRVSR